MEQEQNLTRVPPYISYKSLRTLIEDMRTQGFPTHVDKDVMRRFSGSVRKQLITALRFLKLINTENETTQELSNLVDAKEPEEWKRQLRGVLNEAYGSLMEVNLSQITPTALSKEFRDRFKTKDEVTEKCVRFFVHAARDAGIELSKRITEVSRSRGPRRAAAIPKRQDSSEREGVPENGQGITPPPRQQDPYQVLIDILSPEMQEDEQNAVWTLIRYLKKKEAGQSRVVNKEAEE